MRNIIRYRTSFTFNPLNNRILIPVRTSFISWGPNEPILISTGTSFHIQKKNSDQGQFFIYVEWHIFTFLTTCFHIQKDTFSHSVGQVFTFRNKNIRHLQENCSTFRMTIFNIVKDKLSNLDDTHLFTFNKQRKTFLNSERQVFTFKRKTFNIQEELFLHSGEQVFIFRRNQFFRRTQFSPPYDGLMQGCLLEWPARTG